MGDVRDPGDVDERMRAFFDEIWRGEDPWALETSPFESGKYRRQLDLLGGRRYGRVLEIGCGSGTFTRLLASRADNVTGLDISPSSIARARERLGAQASLEFREANIMSEDLRAFEPWDLVVMSETIYYLGWLYPFFDVAWLASELFGATRPGGRFLMANTFGELEDYLLRPWVIWTYRDLFANVGYRLEHEEVFRGVKDGVQLDVLISLFCRDEQAGGPATRSGTAAGRRGNVDGGAP